MSDLIQPARGTKDLIGNVAREFDYIISKAMKVFETYGYEPIYTPIFEFTEVFKRTLGDYSDVVNKEMYNFEDRGGDSLTLRPEFTASIARSFISNGLTQNLPLKFYSHGPLFRYERPQKGRFRQFHQLNIEALGVSSPKIDGEIIEMAASLLKNFNILEKTELNINSLGCNDSRNAYQKALIEYFSKYISELSEDSKIRLQKNPLRILDSKNETDIKIAKESPKIDKYYTKESAKFFEDVLYYLDLVGVKYNVNQKLVRGLDYYSHTAFEFFTNDLGAQGTVLAGGRYNNLISLMGGQDVPGIGFAAGIERIGLLLEKKIENRPNVIITFGAEEEIEKEAIFLAKFLRTQGITVSYDFEALGSKAMKRANKNNAKLAFLIGSDEVKNKVIKVKNLDNGEEVAVSKDNLIEIIEKILEL